MPVTPFHLGPALLLKALVPRWFSVVSFGVTQCIIDFETIYNISAGNYPLHASAHTIHFGALIGASAGLATSLVGWLLKRTGPRDTLYEVAREFGVAPCLLGGIIGGTSHAILDAIMHPDAGPFRPFDQSNPFLGLVNVWVLHLICLLCSIAGLYLIKTVNGVSVAARLSQSE